jgi:hypothetical protein
MKILILALVVVALITPIFIPFGKRLSSFVVISGGLLAAIWAYHIYLTFLPNNGGYGFGTSVWMFVAFTALYLIIVAVLTLIYWPSRSKI